MAEKKTKKMKVLALMWGMKGVTVSHGLGELLDLACSVDCRSCRIASSLHLVHVCISFN